MVYLAVKKIFTTCDVDSVHRSNARIVLALTAVPEAAPTVARENAAEQKRPLRGGWRDDAE